VSGESVSMSWNAAFKLEFHDADIETDTGILARILADTSDARDFPKLFLQQAERRADILATILARTSVPASASWNSTVTVRGRGGGAQDGLHRVCIVGPDGYSRHAYGGMAGPGDLQLHTPCYVELCADDHVIVADNDNGRIVLLNSALEFVRYLLDFHEPHRLFFDAAVGRLYVGECTNGNVKVFQVVYHLSR